MNWLETEPDRTAKELLQRLREEGGIYSDKQLRTLQRRVKDWRQLEARRLVFATQGPSLAMECAPHEAAR